MRRILYLSVLGSIIAASPSGTSADTTTATSSVSGGVLPESYSAHAAYLIRKLEMCGGDSRSISAAFEQFLAEAEKEVPAKAERMRKNFEQEQKHPQMENRVPRTPAECKNPDPDAEVDARFLTALRTMDWEKPPWRHYELPIALMQTAGMYAAETRTCGGDIDAFTAVVERFLDQAKVRIPDREPQLRAQYESTRVGRERAVNDPELSRLSYNANICERWRRDQATYFISYLRDLDWEAVDESR